MNFQLAANALYERYFIFLEALAFLVILLGYHHFSSLNLKLKIWNCVFFWKFNRVHFGSICSGSLGG